MAFSPFTDRRDARRRRYQDTAACPRVLLASGEYTVADLSPASIRFLPNGVPGFLRGQRLTARIAFPGGEIVATVGAVYRVGGDGIVVRFDQHLPAELLTVD